MALWRGASGALFYLILGQLHAPTDFCGGGCGWGWGLEVCQQLGRWCCPLEDGTVARCIWCLVLAQFSGSTHALTQDSTAAPAQGAQPPTRTAGS